MALICRSVSSLVKKTLSSKVLLTPRSLSKITRDKMMNATFSMEKSMELKDIVKMGTLPTRLDELKPSLNVGRLTPVSYSIAGYELTRNETLTKASQAKGNLAKQIDSSKQGVSNENIPVLAMPGYTLTKNRPEKSMPKQNFTSYKNYSTRRTGGQGSGQRFPRLLESNSTNARILDWSFLRGRSRTKAQPLTPDNSPTNKRGGG